MESFLLVLQAFWQDRESNKNDDTFNESINQSSTSLVETVSRPGAKWLDKPNKMMVTVEFNEENLYESSEDKENKTCETIDSKSKVKLQKNDPFTKLDLTNEFIKDLIDLFGLEDVEQSKLLNKPLFALNPKSSLKDTSRCVVKVFGWTLPSSCDTADDDDLQRVTWNDCFRLLSTIAIEEMHSFYQDGLLDVLNTMTKKNSQTYITNGFSTPMDESMRLEMTCSDQSDHESVLWIAVLAHDLHSKCTLDEWNAAITFFVRDHLLYCIRNLNPKRFAKLKKRLFEESAADAHPQDEIANRLFNLMKSNHLTNESKIKINSGDLTQSQFQKWADQLLSATVDDEAKEMIVEVPSAFSFPSDIFEFKVQSPLIELVEI